MHGYGPCVQNVFFVERIRLGVFDYINIWPVMYLFLFQKGAGMNTGYELVYGNPSTLNASFKKGVLDVSSLSSGCIPWMQEETALLHSLCLGSKNRVGSVLLISKVPLKGLSGHRIFATSASSTSTLLLKIILNRLKIDGEVIASKTPGLSLTQGGAASLFIGDEALQARAAFTDYYQYDLGELWAGLTGKPFVWGVWGIRQEKGLLASRIAADLFQSCREGLNQIPFLAREASKRLGIDFNFIEEYYHRFDYNLSEEHLKSLFLFYRLAHELDLAPSCSKMPFVELAGSHFKTSKLSFPRRRESKINRQLLDPHLNTSAIKPK